MSAICQTGPKRTPEQREQDFVEIRQMNLEGCSLREIAVAISQRRPYSISFKQVSKDLNECFERWKSEQSHTSIDPRNYREIFFSVRAKSGSGSRKRKSVLSKNAIRKHQDDLRVAKHEKYEAALDAAAQQSYEIDVKDGQRCLAIWMEHFGLDPEFESVAIPAAKYLEATSQ